MRIANAEFETGVASLAQLPRSALPEISWAGRSNVGKSSLINRVVGRKNLARTSNTPGKTRQINFYRIDNGWYLVDLPGYGYAAGPRDEREQWGALIEPYLRDRRQIAGIAALIDSRTGATELDRVMFAWLRAHERPWAVILTKTDKISGNELVRVKKAARAEAPDDIPLIACSAESGRGVDDVRAWIDTTLRAHADRTPKLLGWQIDSREEE